MKLTDTAVAKLKLPKGTADKIFFDDPLPGFGIRIREGGSRKYVVHCCRRGKQQRVTIGSAAVLTLDAARAKARKMLVASDDGRDPNAEKAERRAASALILSAIADDYLAAREPNMKPVASRNAPDIFATIGNRCTAVRSRASPAPTLPAACARSRKHPAPSPPIARAAPCRRCIRGRSGRGCARLTPSSARIRQAMVPSASAC